MRLESYLNENEVSIIDLLSKKCMPFVNMFRKENCDRLLYRGRKSPIFPWRAMKSNIADRLPKDTPKNIHDMLNVMFQKKFGWKCRNGVFASSDINMVNDYGDPYVFVPIGRFKFVWSNKIDDLWSTIEHSEYAFFPGEEEGMLRDQYEFEYSEGKSGKWEGKVWVPDESWEDFIDIFQTSKKAYYKDILSGYMDDDLKYAMNKGNEIMFNCDSYFMINLKLEDEVLEWLKNGESKKL